MTSFAHFLPRLHTIFAQSAGLCRKRDWPTASGRVFAICLFARNFWLRSKQAIKCPQKVKYKGMAWANFKRKRGSKHCNVHILSAKFTFLRARTEGALQAAGLFWPILRPCLDYNKRPRLYQASIYLQVQFPRISATFCTVLLVVCFCKTSI
jgi:hypothetical protein